MIAIGYQFVPYLWISLALTFLISALIFYAWKNRTVLGAGSFLHTLFLVEAWIAAQAFEMAALDLPQKIVWANLQYIPIALTPLTFLYLTLQYTRHENWLKLRFWPYLFLIAPIALNILVWTNDSHGLIRQNVYLNLSGLFPTVGKTYGPVFWAYAAFNYLITILSMAVLAKVFKEKMTLYKKQIVFLFIALALPVVSNIFHISGLNPFNVDTTPSFFGLSAILIGWGIFRYRLFDVVPIARSIIIQKMKTGVIVLDSEGRILDFNPAAEKMLNLEFSELNRYAIETVLSDFPELISAYRERNDAVFEMAVKNNEIPYCYEVSFVRIKNSAGKPIGFLIQIYDITERKISEEEIKRAAYFDSLTGLPNKNYFIILFSKVLARAGLNGDTIAVAYLDLDNFKIINDTYGHDVGDLILGEIGERLKSTLRESDVLSRIGGDEFAIVLPRAGNDGAIGVIAKKLLNMFEKGFDYNGITLEVRASIGFSVFPRDGDNIDMLLKKADMAMYSIKNREKNYYYIYKEQRTG